MEGGSAWVEEAAAVAGAAVAADADGCADCDDPCHSWHPPPYSRLIVGLGPDAGDGEAAASAGGEVDMEGARAPAAEPVASADGCEAALTYGQAMEVTETAEEAAAELPRRRRPKSCEAALAGDEAAADAAEPAEETAMEEEPVSGLPGELLGRQLAAELEPAVALRGERTGSRGGAGARADEEHHEKHHEAAYCLAGCGPDAGGSVLEGHDVGVALTAAMRVAAEEEDEHEAEQRAPVRVVATLPSARPCIPRSCPSLARLWATRSRARPFA